MVDPAGEEARAEPVVDVDYTHAAGAGVEHAQKRRQAAKVGPVAHAGGHGDHRAVHETSQHTGQCPLHPGDGDQYAGLHDLREPRLQPVQPGHAHIVDPLDLVAQRLGGQRGLLGHGDVAGPAGGHHDFAQPVRLGKIAHDPHPGVGMVINGELSAKGVGLFLA